MKVVTIDHPDAEPVCGEVPHLHPQTGEVLVKLKAAALNHRDVWIAQKKYAAIQYPAILGSDGAGLLDQKEVIINPNIGWGQNIRFPEKGYQILGMPSQGTFSEYISIAPDRIVDKPGHLSWHEAAALPLAGLTAYRCVVTKANIHAGDRVLITGIGGGVALFALQFSLSLKALVWVTSGDEGKIDRAKALGAQDGAVYKTSNWDHTLKVQAGEFDVIIDGAAGEGFGRLLKLCAPGARVVSYGGTLGVVNNYSPQLVFWKQLSILGTTMGSDEEFQDMVRLVETYKIKPVVDSVYAKEEAHLAFQRMALGKQFGKIVINIS